MKKNFFMLAIISVLIADTAFISTAMQAFAESWYPGEGLKQGDYYRYDLCWTDWHNCSPLEIDFWVQNKTSDGESWNVQMVAHDSSIVQKGLVRIGTINPAVNYADKSIADYANVYKNTIAWLSAFSTGYSPQDLNSPSWGRTGSVGGQTVSSMGGETVTVPAGTFKTAVIGWHKTLDSKIWVDQKLAFPVKSEVYVDVTSGTPPPDYTLSLIGVGNSPTEPKFLNVIASEQTVSSEKCPKPDFQSNSVHGQENTDTGSILIEYRYSPSVPVQGCPIEWRLWFEKNYDPEQKYNQVHYDIFTVSDNGEKLHSYAQSRGRADVFAPVGFDDITFIQEQPPPLTHYLIYFHGLGPQDSYPSVSLAGLIKVDVVTAPPLDNSPSATGTTVVPTGDNVIVIPSWIKNTAKWWSEGQVGDSDFVKGIQYMIQNEIMKVPYGESDSSGSQSIPQWVKNSAGWWADGQISDGEFVKGLQYLISSGIMKV